MASQFDIVVVGAGSAGIAAGRRLAAAGLSFVLLEARDRVGGRAFSSPCGTSHMLDLGCEWLHSADRNILAELAPTLGFTIDRREPPWRHRNRQRNFTLDDQEIFAAEQSAFWARLAEAGALAQETGVDRRADELLDPSARFNPFIDAISTYYNGAPLERVSVIDFDRYLDTEEDWRVEGGYGSLFATLAATLPVRLGCQVAAVDSAGRRLRLDTNQGSIEAERLIVTVPTTVLASGAIRFAPALDDHLQAAADLPLGVADKLFFTLREPEAFQADTRLVGSPHRRDTGTYTLRSRGRALVEGYFGGDYARDLERGGLDAFVAAARREIADAYGSDLSDRLTPIVATEWASDPFSRGSYSHALPGRADARARLAAPVDERIFFAGEATSPQFFSTAHGAFEEGSRVARHIASRSKPHRAA